MRGQNKNLVTPDFLNLGVARPQPRGTLGLAPRAAWLLAWNFGDPSTQVRVNRSPLLIATYLLPLSQQIPGALFSPITSSPLLPNPYQS